MRAIAEVITAVDHIDGMSQEIATAAEQQSLVSQELNRSVHAISDSVSATVRSAQQTADETNLLTQASQELKTVIQQVSS